MTQTANAKSARATESQQTSEFDEPSSGEDDASRRKVDPSTQTDEAASFEPRRGTTAELGGMILAFLFGIAGFAVRFSWIPALVIMAVVFGMILSDRRKSKSNKSIVTEIVATIASEARDIHEAVSGPSIAGDNGDDATTDSNDAHDEANDGGDSAQESPRLALVTALKGEEPAPTNDASSLMTNASSTSDAPKGRGAIDQTVGEPEPQSGETVRLPTVEGDGSTEPDDTDSERLDLVEPSTSPAAIQEIRFPGRLIVSADRMAARNRLLRPVRRHLLVLVTSIGEALVQVSTPSPSHSDQPDLGKRT